MSFRIFLCPCPDKGFGACFLCVPNKYIAYETDQEMMRQLAQTLNQ